MLRRSMLVAPLALLLVISASGCGAQPRSAAPSAGAVASALKGSPPPLAALHAEANRLLGGGTAAFKSLLTDLHGYPVVVNKWASWCGPCKSEFPAFQRAGVAYGKRVAFVALNGKDSIQSARGFLRAFPVTYPSYVDPQENIARTIEAGTYYPLTVYIDRSGRIVFVHAGAYSSAGALEKDVRRYVLG